MNAAFQPLQGRSGPCFAILLAGMVFLFACMEPAFSLELEPRRWGHLPVDAFYTGLGYAYLESDIFLDPVLQIVDGESTTHTVALRALYSFDLMGRTANLGAFTAYTEGEWKGLLSGEPARTSRHGFQDPVLRLAVNFVGAPALKGQEFFDYRKNLKSETIVGAALALHLPAGQYYSDKLINLGENRWTIRPQFGVVHTRDRWSTELSASVRVYTDNEDFFGMTREQEPMYGIQGHLIYTSTARWWVSGSAGYGFGGATTIDNVAKNDERGFWLVAASAGCPLSRRTNIKVAGLVARSEEDVGSDSNGLLVGFGRLW